MGNELYFKATLQTLTLKLNVVFQYTSSVLVGHKFLPLHLLALYMGSLHNLAQHRWIRTVCGRIRMGMGIPICVQQNIYIAQVNS